MIYLTKTEKENSCYLYSSLCLDCRFFFRKKPTVCRYKSSGMQLASFTSIGRVSRKIPHDKSMRKVGTATISVDTCTTNTILRRCVSIYEIGCVNANSAMQFEEGPRLGVFEKVKFIRKKPKKENN